MTDSTLRIRRSQLIAWLAVILCLVLWAPEAARADGDPASDVLATQTLFLPQDAGASAAQQLQLQGLLSAAARNGYPIRVAVIASSSDLGSVTELWAQPQTYARFLDEELSLVYRGPLLVVMPAGYGLAELGRPLSAPPTLGVNRGGLAASASTDVERMAAAAGHVLSPPRAASPAASGGGDVLPWVVFGVGAGLIGAAWAASLRARPLREGLL